MSTPQIGPSWTEISRCQLSASERFHVSLKLYKTIKALTALVAAWAAILAIEHGAEPMAVYTVLGAILVGPEILEYSIANGAARDDDDA